MIIKQINRKDKILFKIILILLMGFKRINVINKI